MKWARGTDELVGTFLGPYEIRAQIGAGGMGVVFEALPAHGDPVAIKVLHPERLNDERSIQRFENEGAAGSLVKHPNLASTIGRGCTEEGLPFLVMDRVRGESLGRRLEHDGPLPLRSAVAIALQVLDALDALHGSGIVHGDVKSDNVLVEAQDDGSDHAVLIDFGLAHLDFLDAEPQLPQLLVAGTPEYMAPEVIRGRGSTIASDLYALGIVLYELIAGQTPFTGGTSNEIVRRHLGDDVVPPSLRRDGAVPASLERVVLRALEKAPAKRFASAVAFHAALTAVIPHLARAQFVEPHATFSREAPTIEWPRAS